MQPMGRLSMHSKCLDFFSFKFWGWGAGGFFSFFLCSKTSEDGGKQAPQFHHFPTHSFES